jgi:hypothetical protein
MGDPCAPRSDRADLGDLVLVLLAGTLAGLRDRLYADGYPSAGGVAADLVEFTDDYLAARPDEA